MCAIGNCFQELSGEWVAENRQAKFNLKKAKFATNARFSTHMDFSQLKSCCVFDTKYIILRLVVAFLYVLNPCIKLTIITNNPLCQINERVCIHTVNNSHSAKPYCFVLINYVFVYILY